MVDSTQQKELKYERGAYECALDDERGRLYGIRRYPTLHGARLALYSGPDIKKSLYDSIEKLSAIDLLALDIIAGELVNSIWCLPILERLARGSGEESAD